MYEREGPRQRENTQWAERRSLFRVTLAQLPISALLCLSLPTLRMGMTKLPVLSQDIKSENSRHSEQKEQGRPRESGKRTLMGGLYWSLSPDPDDSCRCQKQLSSAQPTPRGAPVPLVRLPQNPRLPQKPWLEANISHTPLRDIQFPPASLFLFQKSPSPSWLICWWVSRGATCHLSFSTEMSIRSWDAEPG